jgi:hypothetical protein
VSSTEPGGEAGEGLPSRRSYEAAHGESLTLTFYNQSASGGYCAIAQTDTIASGQGYWLTEYANPDGSVAFTWTTDYAFCWTDSGTLVPGVRIAAEQLLPSDLQTNNEVTLTYDTVVSSFTFTDQRQGQQSDTLTVVADASLPPGMASVADGSSWTIQPTHL